MRAGEAPKPSVDVPSRTGDVWPIRFGAQLEREVDSIRRGGDEIPHSFRINAFRRIRQRIVEFLVGVDIFEFLAAHEVHCVIILRCADLRGRKLYFGRYRDGTSTDVLFKNYAGRRRFGTPDPSNALIRIWLNGGVDQQVSTTVLCCDARVNSMAR